MGTLVLTISTAFPKLIRDNNEMRGVLQIRPNTAGTLMDVGASVKQDYGLLQIDCFDSINSSRYLGLLLRIPDKPLRFPTFRRDVCPSLATCTEYVFLHPVRQRARTNQGHSTHGVVNTEKGRRITPLFMSRPDLDKSANPLLDAPEEVDDILPDYHEATASRYTTHCYTLRNGKEPWLTFELKSRAKKADDIPYFFGHVPITGRVILDLDQPEFMEAIEIEV
jgi:hypothetical protein